MSKQTIQIQTITDLIVSIQDGNNIYNLNPSLVTSSYDVGTNSITIDSPTYNLSLNYPNSQYVFQINDLNYNDNFADVSTILNDAIFVSITQEVTDAVNNNGIKIDTTNTELGVINTSIDTVNTSVGTVNTSIGTSNTKLDTINTSVGTVNTSVGTVNTTLTSGNVKTQVVPTSSKARLTITSSAVATNGSITAGALFIEFITSSDFTGTINGVSIPNLAIMTFPYMPGYDYPAISYTVTGGTLYIRTQTA